MKGHLVRVLGGMAALSVAAGSLALFSAVSSDSIPECVVQDWLSEPALRRYAPPPPNRPITPEDDAAGGCDGVRNGEYGFHTGADDAPWWQVDLGSSQRIDSVVIYNRCSIPDRAARIELQVSDDGQGWAVWYRHEGTLFHGVRGGPPLTVRCGGAAARYIRLVAPGAGFLHLDEVEVYGADTPARNLALHRPATQCSVSPWSRFAPPALGQGFPVEEVVRRGKLLAADLATRGVDVTQVVRLLNAIDPADASRANYLRARAAVRTLVMRNPLLNFEQILCVKRAPGQYSHMSDQYLGWWSRPGGGVYVLEGWKTGRVRERCLTSGLPEGSALTPELSYDGRTVLFSWCRYYPQLASAVKLDKQAVPEDAFYHVYQVNLDGTGLKRLTHGPFDHFDARWLPDGRIVFLSTRRGASLVRPSTRPCDRDASTPDGYVRCGGDAVRPVAVYTLHTMAADGSDIRPISAFESFEWTPSVARDGRILYARWDYVDRDNMPYMKLWSTLPDGGHPRIEYGNYTSNPHCVFEAREIPGSHRFIATASGHHSITGGSLILLDPNRAVDGDEAITRLTPEVCFPETEGWPTTYFASPWPLSETYHLVGWSSQPLGVEGAVNPVNAMGLYVLDTFGNLELICRDPDISVMYPIPVRPRAKPQIIPATARADQTDGLYVLADVNRGLPQQLRGQVKALRIVALPTKPQPWMNTPHLGVTGDDPGKAVLGVAPVEADGSACFQVPGGMPVFFQALDAHGRAIQTMRSATYVQPGQTLSCIGCHERRDTAPPPLGTLQALQRRPSAPQPEPDGSWPIRYDILVQPVLDQNCAGCHAPGGKAEHLPLTQDSSYDRLLDTGSPSLRQLVSTAYRRGRSVPGETPSVSSGLAQRLDRGHGKPLTPEDRYRLNLWMDTYAQVRGAFSDQQEREIESFRKGHTNSAQYRRAR